MRDAVSRMGVRLRQREDEALATWVSQSASQRTACYRHQERMVSGRKLVSDVMVAEARLSISRDGGSWRLWWLRFFLLCLVLCPTFASLAQEHVCAHDTHIVPQLRAFHEQRKVNKRIRILMEEKEAKEGKGGELQGSQEMVYSKPIRIQPVYLLGSLQESSAQFLKEWLIPQAIRYLQRAISVKRPVQGNLRLKPECTKWTKWSDGRFQCSEWLLSCLVVDRLNASHLEEYTTCPSVSDDGCVKTPGGEGIPDADFILYVTAMSTSTCGQTTAGHAGACAFDHLTDRPVAGNVNFCPSFFEVDKMTRPIGRLSIAIHEITHALVFSQSLFENFRDEAGEYRITRSPSKDVFPNSTQRAVEDISPVVGTFDEREREVKKIVTPKVLKEAREHFGCPTLNGAELENNGGDGTSFSHWESRIFVGELMEAAATVNQQIMSRITLALFEDSGWYVANYEVAGFLSFGRGKGCAFALKACNDPSAGVVFKDYACQSSTDKGNLCTYDGFAVGFCSSCGANDASCTADGCGRVTGYNNFLCIDGNSSFSSAMGMRTGPSSRCFRQGPEQWSSRTYPSIGSGAGCYERRCEHDKSTGYQLFVAVESDVWLQCIDNQMVALPSQYFRSGSLGPCPVAKDYCLYNHCLNDCSGKGHCFNGTCYCFPSYGDYDCSKDTCFPSSCPSGKVCDDHIGICRQENEVPARPQSILPAMKNRGTGESTQLEQYAACTGLINFSWSGRVNATSSEFRLQFKQSMLNAAEKQSSRASFAGEVKVELGDDSRVSLSELSSLTVNYIVKFVPKSSTLLDVAQTAAEYLSAQIANDVQSIFSSNPFFADKGNVTVKLNTVTSPESGTGNGLLPNNIPKKILGIKTVFFALMVGLVLSSLISLLCCCTCFRRKSGHPKYYHRHNPAYPALRPYPSSAPPSRTVYA